MNRVKLLLILALAMLPLGGCLSGGPYGKGWGDATELHKAAFNGSAADVRRASQGSATTSTVANIPAYGMLYTPYVWRANPIDLAVFGENWPAVFELARLHPELADELLARCGYSPEAIPGLLHLGASPNAVVTVTRGDGVAEEMQPLLTAVRKGGTQGAKAARLLLRAGAAPKYQSANQSILFATPDIEVISALVREGVDINARDMDGNTKLHLSAANGQLTDVEAILKLRADRTLRNNAGQTPIEYARHERRTHSPNEDFESSHAWVRLVELLGH